MATQYTSILKLALPTQGELSGSWGTVVNDNITQMVEQAIAGLATINTWSSESHTLTSANGATSESRCAMLVLANAGAAPASAASVICPALTKTYIVKNGCGQAATLKTSSGTGIAVPNGKTMLLFCDGTNVVEAVDHVVTMSAGTLTITGLTTFASMKGADATTVTGILDEDNMASNSATKLVTQQSVKAYVDAQVGSFDTLAEVLANGNTTGTTDIEVDAAQKVQFRDAAIYINSSVDGQLDIVADTEIQIVSTTVDLNGNLDVSGTALVTGVLTTTATQVATGGITSGSDIISDTDSTDSLGSTGVRWLKGWFDTLTAGTLTIGSGSVTDSSGAISFGNENLTTTGIVTAAGTSVFASLDISGDVDVDGTTNLDVVDIDGAVNMATTALVTGVLTTTATQVATGGITSGSNIVSDTDSTDDLGTTSVRWANLFVDGITATDQITATGFTGTLDGILGSGAAAAATVTTLDTSGAVNLNLVTDSSSSTSGALIVDGGVGIAKKLYVGTDLDVDGTTNLDVVDIDGAVQADGTVTVGVDDTGYDVKFFGATTGKSLLWDESADSLIVTGTTTLVGTTNLDAVDIDGAVQADGTITVGVDDTGYDVKFFGATTGKSLLWDESADSLIVTGTTTLVGTTNLDAVDIDGAVQADGTITVGVDDTGYDVKFFGATTGKSLLWDESADSLIVTGTTTLVGTTNLDAVDIDGAVQADGTITVGVDDTGYDVKFFGATTGKSLLWDESADSLIVTGTIDATTVEFDNLSGTGAVNVTNILDEDNMASDSATALATQQSIKAYVDSQVGTVDTLSEILANGNTTGANDIDVDAAQKVQFRDAAIYINSSADGQLDIVADTEIQIAATTVDLNGNLDVSGTALVTGVLTTTATQVATGGITSGSDIISDTDSTDSLGSTGVRWLKGWFDTLTAGTLTIGSGSVTDSSGAISFGNENLTTTGIVTAAGTSVFASLDISGDIDVDGTTNLDVVDIDGAVDMASTLNVAGAFTSLGIDDNATSNAITIDSSERIMMGHTSAIQGHRLEVTGDGGTAAVGVFRFDASAAAPTVELRKSRNASIGGHTILQDDDGLGRIDFKGSDGVGWIYGAQILASVDGTPGTNDMPGKLEFRTTSDGSTALATRLTIGNVGAFTTNPAAGGHAVFNEAGIDADFRVESDGNVNMLFVDGENNKVGIGTSAPARTLSIWDTVNGYNLELQQRSAYNSGNQSGVVFSAKYHSDGSVTDLASIRGGKDNTTDGNYGGKVAIWTRPNGGSDTAVATWDSQGAFTTRPRGAGNTVFNEDGVDSDFRVESDGNANMLFVDGENNRVGIGTNSPAEALTVNGNIGISDGKIYNGAGSNSAGVSLPNSTVRIDGYNGITFHSSSTTVGSQTERMSLAAGSTVFNDVGADTDFRVESSGNANMLFVDGGINKIGVGSVPTASLAGGATFSVAGSTGIANAVNSGTFKKFLVMAGNATATVGTLTGSAGATASAFMHGANHYATVGNQLMTYIKLAATRINGDLSWTDIDNTTVAVASANIGAAEPTLAWANGVLTVVTAANQGFIGTIEVMWGQGSAVFTSA
jgi:DUF2075 family protein